MVIPKWLQKHITGNDIQRLENKIASLEQECDVEVVPVIVKASSSYPQTKVTLALLFIAVFLELWHILDISWHWDGLIEASVFLAAFVFAVFGLAPYFSRFGRVQMALTHKHVEHEQCWWRSEVEFRNGKVSETRRRNGILVFISMLEHKVIVKGDEAIFAKLPAHVWMETVNTIVKGIREGRMADGLSEALDVMERLLKAEFPVKSEKQNELANTFIIKE